MSALALNVKYPSKLTKEELPSALIVCCQRHARFSYQWQAVAPTSSVFTFFSSLLALVTCYLSPLSLLLFSPFSFCFCQVIIPLLLERNYYKIIAGQMIEQHSWYFSATAILWKENNTKAFSFEILYCVQCLGRI